MSDQRRLTILLYGNFDSIHLGSSYQLAFEQLGHRVIPFDIREAKSHLSAWMSHRVGHRLTLHHAGLRRRGTGGWNDRLLRCAKAQAPDLIFLLNAEYLMPETLRELRTPDRRVFIFHADNPFPPHYANRAETLPDALEVDCYFSWSRALVERLRFLGVKRAEYLPFGWDERMFPYIGLLTNPEHDVVFVGGWDKEREALLTTVAGKFNLKIWGPDYWSTRVRRRSPLRECWQGRLVTGPEAAYTLANSKVVLNIVRTQNLPDGVIMRTFEVPGCGGFLVSTRTSGATDIFPEGEAGAYFGDVDECISSIERYLACGSERDIIASRSHEIVSQGHRMTHRAQEVLQVYSSMM